jgi:2-hydroxychromene-2-carboxylate isomerase
LQGFKRVYHKEEFQRTEHFYDDEEAKKIAESYGLADAQEKAAHGKKDDKRKYHVRDEIELKIGVKFLNAHSIV